MPSGPRSTVVNAASTTMTSAAGRIVEEHPRQHRGPGGRGTAARRSPEPTQKFTTHMTTPASSSHGSASTPSAVDADGGEQRRGGDRLPAVGREVGQVAGAHDALAARPARRSAIGTRSTSSAGSGPSKASVISASGRPASKRTPRAQRDLVEVRDHREGDQQQQQPGPIPARLRSPARSGRAPAPRPATPWIARARSSVRQSRHVRDQAYTQRRRHSPR